ncbi:hypothetical protein KRM28CT15_25250 [Krasilnikovia sp. M28-CT-15]
MEIRIDALIQEIAEMHPDRLKEWRPDVRNHGKPQAMRLERFQYAPCLPDWLSNFSLPCPDLGDDILGDLGAPARKIV